jgi:hypothetical protein
MTKANTLAYYGMATITAVKCYGTCLVTKLFNFVTETKENKLVLSSSRYLRVIKHSTLEEDAPVRAGFDLTRKY